MLKKNLTSVLHQRVQHIIWPFEMQVVEIDAHVYNPQTSYATFTVEPLLKDTSEISLIRTVSEVPIVYFCVQINF